MKGNKTMNEPDESTMFSTNTEKDDIALLANLLSQWLDWNDNVEPTVDDPVTGMDWGTEEILGYIRRKYGDNF